MAANAMRCDLPCLLAVGLARSKVRVCPGPQLEGVAKSSARGSGGMHPDGGLGWQLAVSRSRRLALLVCLTTVAGRSGSPAGRGGLRIRKVKGGVGRGGRAVRLGIDGSDPSSLGADGH